MLMRKMVDNATPRVDGTVALNGVRRLFLGGIIISTYTPQMDEGGA